MYSYRAYGFCIHSELHLPELRVCIKDSADITIKLGKLDAFSHPCKMNRKCIRANDSEVLLSYANIASFHIIKDNQIIVDPVPGIDERHIRPWLLSHVLGILLHQRGLLVLHGSAVASNGKAIVFIGPSGSGKSTAAASLKKKGYLMLADDIVAIDMIGGKPFVFPGFPLLKLLPDIARSLELNLISTQYSSPNDGKIITHFESDFVSDPIPLKRIYLIEKGDAIKICLLGAQDSTIGLVRNSYSLVSLKARVNLSSHFVKCTKVAGYIPISRLIRSSDPKNLADFAQAIDEDIKNNK
jgi:hypothetical protein